MSEEVKNEFTFDNPEYRQTYWHTCSHVMAQAVKRLWPEVKLAIGPSIDEGWYYDMDAPFAFTPEHTWTPPSPSPPSTWSRSRRR